MAGDVQLWCTNNQSLESDYPKQVAMNVLRNPGLDTQKSQRLRCATCQLTEATHLITTP